jgi:DNA polymerase III subunit epsilon
MDFVAIDFETATQLPASPCQFAAVVVRSGVVVGQYLWLVRPPEGRFLRGNTAIHGISARHVRGVDQWDQRWIEIEPLLASNILVAHYAPFDFGVLTATMRHYQLPLPKLHFTCSCAMARRAWPGRASYSLKALAREMSWSFRHHDALEDARASAEILLSIGRQWQAESVGQLEHRLGMERGWCDGSQVVAPRRGSPQRALLRQSPIDSLPTNQACDDQA